ncbi:UNVERIFIED_CONTAM: hypothetical protein K2H54_056546 [Gekko kuhli]
MESSREAKEGSGYGKTGASKKIPSAKKNHQASPELKIKHIGRSIKRVGYYMFIEASKPRVKGDKARLISPVYNVTAKFCVSYYYHMYGKHIGE